MVLLKNRMMVIAAALAYGLPQAAWAGPPFFTDDPEPVDYQHWEINTAFQSTHVHGDTTGDAPVFDINYGALPNVQVHITPALAFDNNRTIGTHYGYGDTELGVKYRFLNTDKNDWWPEVALYPLVELPTGDLHEGLSTTGHMREFLPLWLQKDFGQWTTYGGGGYWNNAGIGNKNYWYFGWAVQRKITDNLMLGGELYHQTSNTAAGDIANVGSTGFNLGGSNDLSKDYHLLFSAGQALQNVAATNAFSYYLGVQWTF
jgi:hypothetical protein